VLVLAAARSCSVRKPIANGSGARWDSGSSSMQRLRRGLCLRKAVVLAAGRGTRMGSLTADLPKPMLPVGGRPMLEHVLQGLHTLASSSFSSSLATGER
jgi:hypothetical protein